MTRWAVVNGSFVDYSEAKVPVEDRGLQFGDGLYEVARIYRGSAFLLEEHLARMVSGAKEIELAFPWDERELVNILNELIERNGVEEGLLYWQITRGVAPRLHTFPANTHPTLIAYTLDFTPNPANWEKGIKVSIQPDKRWLMCNVKTVNLLGNVLAKEAAKRQGAAEALMEREGYGVIEASSSNLFIISEGVVKTPPLSPLILPGITRKVVLKLIERLGLTLKEGYFSKEELLKADEVFITSTSVEVTPVVQVDDTQIGDGKPGAITSKLIEAYRQEVAASVGQ